MQQDALHGGEARKVTVFEGKELDLQPETFTQQLREYDVVLVDFYADWCRFCQMLKPAWIQTAKALKGRTGIAIATLDCVKYPQACKEHKITKYPTMKVFRRGVEGKKEYRGARTTEAFVKYLESESTDKVQHVTSSKALDDVIEASEDKRMIVGFFSKEASPMRGFFDVLATRMRDDCQFVVVEDEAVTREHGAEVGTIVYKTDPDHKLDEQYDGSMDISELYRWARQKCLPLVRELTFANVEGIAEEAKPFLIFFYNPKDEGKGVRLFKKTVEEHPDIVGKRQFFNFLIADGTKFTVPLSTMNKKVEDLPVLALDSFNKMYNFGNPNCLAIPDKLEKFMSDFQSGELHRLYVSGEYHPYSCEKELDMIVGLHEEIISDFPEEMKNVVDNHRREREDSIEMGGDGDYDGEENRVHDSVFKHLKPGVHRYSMHDEL